MAEHQNENSANADEEEKPLSETVDVSKAAEEGASEEQVSKEAPVLVKKPFSWGKPAPVATTASTSTKKSLADIMAEESETKMAANAAFQDNRRSLAEIEAEQESLFKSFQHSSPDSQPSPTVKELKSPPPGDVAERPHGDGKSHAIADTKEPPSSSTHVASSGEADWLGEARNHLSEAEIEEIERALREADVGQDNRTSAPESTDSVGLSKEEAAAIAAALKEADAKEEEESMWLALQIQQEELAQIQIGAVRKINARHDDDDIIDESAGFRMNSAAAQGWTRRDRNTIIGPNNEIRTKHDVQVQGQTNAHLLGLDEDDFRLRTHVGNQAFNSFKKSMKRTTKGVATHGTGRAGTDSDAVKGKAMDPHVRLQISKAVNSGLIEHCNGAVKQGKEAVVFHAEGGVESQGHDVAVKVFKRITEFRGRGAYVDGDPRYQRQSFRNSSEREQLEIWTEKEFRNLVRANRSKVPVPSPLLYKENIIFMRFMGSDGWPAPQIREVRMRKGSKKWEILYNQVLEAIRRLYTGAKLVHGDLSEYNILVAPSFQVENVISSVDDSEMDLQVVLIDFGQAVEIRHPEATSLLYRDLDRVRSFFLNQGVATLSIEESLSLVQDSGEAEVEVEDHKDVSSSDAVETLS